MHHNFHPQTSIPQYHKKVEFSSSRQTWISASNLPELLQLKADYPTSHIVAGNTYLGKDTYRDFPLDFQGGVGSCLGTWISASTLPELLQLKADNPTAYIVAGNTYLGMDTFLYRDLPIDFQGGVGSCLGTWISASILPELL